MLKKRKRMQIRKISIGSDYKTSSMHYIHGQEVLGGEYLVHLIKYDHDLESYSVWIEKDGEILLWKQFNRNIPVCIEYNINF